MPSYAERGNVWAIQVCELLGLDPGRVMSIRIDAAPRDLLTVSVVMLANADELAATRQALLAHLREVRLSTESLETGFAIGVELIDTTSITDEAETCA